MNNEDIALATYDDSRNFEEIAFKQNHQMLGVDSGLHHAMCKPNCITFVDLAMLMLSDIMLQETGERHHDTVVYYVPRMKPAEQLYKAEAGAKVIISTAILARFYHMLGIAELGMHRPNKAGKAFSEAYKILADHRYRQGWELAKAWQTLEESARKLRFNSMLATLPKKPLAVPDISAFFVVTFIL